MHWRLKSLLPRGLFGRAILILVLPVVVVQLTVSIAFIQRHFEGVTRQMTEGVLIEMRYLLSRADAPSDLASAQAAVAELADQLDLQVSVPFTPADIPQPD